MQRVRKSLVRGIALVTSMVMMATTAIFASPMKDVSTSHWAYSDIMEMQKRGLLLPSSQGEFFPNGYVTFFELSQILAKATGYQDESVNPNMNSDLKKAIANNYEKQKPVIEAYEKNYKHWQKDANKEIAYLLGKGYIEEKDLGKFMSKSTSGVESKRGVRKQEAAVYLVRILHKAKTAVDEYVSTGFVDEAKIDAAYRPYVAYMKKLGIVNGDQNGEYGPTLPITRAQLSKMLVDTLKIKETPAVEQKPETPQEPTDKALEGKFTKMISRGDDGYYIVLEVEPGKTHTYSIESTASVQDQNGQSLSLATLKSKIDAQSDKGLIVTASVELIGTTEYITKVKIVEQADNPTPPVVEKPEVEKPVIEKPKVERPEIDQDKLEESYSGSLTGKIHSILIGPESKITIQVSNKEQKTFKIDFDAKVYSNLKRKDILLWDLRLNQEADLKVVKGQVESLEITKAAPPITFTGTIIKTSINGDEIQMRIADSVKTINVPMATQILDGKTEKGRIDLKEDMEIVVVYGENEEAIPEQIIILSK